MAARNVRYAPAHPRGAQFREVLAGEDFDAGRMHGCHPYAGSGRVNGIWTSNTC
jgi:hypothetical protein